MIEVYKTGSLVAVSLDGEVEGTVQSVNIRGGLVTYEVRWWDGRSVKSEWFQASEVNPVGSCSMVQIGFKESK